MLRTATLIIALSLTAIVSVAQNRKVTLNTPADGEQYAPIRPNFAWDTLLVQTDSFVMELSEMADFSIIHRRALLLGFSYSYRPTSPLSYSTNYYWRIITYDSNAFFVDTSDVSTFRTVDVPPGTPRNVSPTTASLNLGLNPVLKWTSVSAASKYRVHIATMDNFSDTAFHGIVNAPDTSVTVNIKLEPYTVYFWRVAAENANGLGEWSNFWNFTTLYTGLHMPSGNFAMAVYPNPATEQLTLSYNANGGLSKIGLFDMQGKQVAILSESTVEPGSQTVQISRNNLPAGVYFIKIEENGLSQALKVVLN